MLKIYAAIRPSASVGDALDAPLALQEMVLAVWLIAKGFNNNVIRPDQGGSEGAAMSRESGPHPVPELTSD
jgi:hypothetical protein